MTPERKRRAAQKEGFISWAGYNKFDRPDISLRTMRRRRRLGLLTYVKEKENAKILRKLLHVPRLMSSRSERACQAS